MAKFIKYKARLMPDLNTVRVVITEQSDSVGSFSNSSWYEFVAKNGVALISFSRPFFYSPSRIYVQGNSKERNNDPIFLEVEDYRRFKEAVLEYNEYYSDMAIAERKASAERWASVVSNPLYSFMRETPVNKNVKVNRDSNTEPWKQKRNQRGFAYKIR